MKISNMRKIYKKNSGFTLIELIVVMAGLAALSSFTIPSFLNSIKLNRIEEAKAIMNGYAADCLGKFRISTDPVDFIENAAPEDLDNMKLNTLGYMIDGDQSKCSNLGIKPISENEKNLYAFDFRITSEGQVIKTGTPSDNPRFLNSCRGWAGKNCGLSEDQKAEFERLAAISKAKSECIAAYNSWLSEGSSGEFTSWDNEEETCTKAVFAFEGIPVNSAEAIEQAINAKYGRICIDWRTGKKTSNSISPNGNPETIKECVGVNYWFHTGEEFTTQAGFDAKNSKAKELACIADKQNAISKKVTGEYTYRPTPGPDPCGKVVWLCGDQEYPTLDSYNSSSCAKPPANSGGFGSKPQPQQPDRCKNFDRTKIRGCSGFGWQTKPQCTCR